MYGVVSHSRIDEAVLNPGLREYPSMFYPIIIILYVAHEAVAYKCDGYVYFVRSAFYELAISSGVIVPDGGITASMLLVVRNFVHCDSRHCSLCQSLRRFRDNALRGNQGVRHLSPGQFHTQSRQLAVEAKDVRDNGPGLR
jgi:hypothetical protein